jgi:hypothetical protein
LVKIIGTGWYGFIAAQFLSRRGVEYEVYTKGKEFNSSLNNQNRLHAGFHYPRAENTVLMCQPTFRSFKSRFSFMLESQTRPHRYYVHRDTKNADSTIKRYIEMMKDFPYSSRFANPHDPECVFGIETPERIISPRIFQGVSKNFFDNCGRKVIYGDFDLNDINEKDIVLDCTYNRLGLIPREEGQFLETIVVHAKTSDVDDYNYTVMDGPFYSVMHEYEDNVTLTHVELGTYTRENAEALREMRTRETIEFFRFKGILKSSKVSATYAHKFQAFNDTADRPFLVHQTNNIHSVSCSKINGIFQWEHYLDKLFTKNTKI